MTDVQNSTLNDIQRLSLDNKIQSSKKSDASCESQGDENLGNPFDLPIISSNESTIFAAPLTKEIFLDAYSKGMWNLSIVSQPECFKGTTLLRPPEVYAEARRLRNVDHYMNLPHWGNKDTFIDIINKAANLFDCKGAEISIIDPRFQKVKFQRGLNFAKCSRFVSIDAHTILSAGFLTLLDASQDWRFQENPFVKSSPHIRFYTGVPLISPTNDVIGVFSVFDPFPRLKIKESDVQTLQIYANNIMLYLGTDYTSISSQIPNISAKSRTGNNTISTLLLSENTKKSLLKQFGRATSIGSSGPLSTVFEKDGSGSRYLTNAYLKFGVPTDMIDISVWKKLVSCVNGKNASQLLCNNLAEKYKFDGIYIMEIAISQPFRIGSDFFPPQNEVELDSFVSKERIESLGEQITRSKIIGSFGLSDRELGQIKSHFINFRAFRPDSGDSGVVYLTKENRVKYHSGICLPFYKKKSKLVRQESMARSMINVGINTKGGSESVPPFTKLYLRSGCYVIGGFNNGFREYSNEEIGYVFNCASILRRIYLMN